MYMQQESRCTVYHNFLLKILGKHLVLALVCEVLLFRLLISLPDSWFCTALPSIQQRVLILFTSSLFPLFLFIVTFLIMGTAINLANKFKWKRKKTPLLPWRIQKNIKFIIPPIDADVVSICSCCWTLQGSNTFFNYCSAQLQERRLFVRTDIGWLCINWSVTGLRTAANSDGEDMDLNDWTEVWKNKRVILSWAYGNLKRKP